jgi:hypothetical protein
MQFQTQCDRFDEGVSEESAPWCPVTSEAAPGQPEPAAELPANRGGASAPLTAPEASARLETIIEQAFLAAQAWRPNRSGPSAPGVGIGASAGIGKTETILEGLVRHGGALLRKGHVLFQFPTLELAEQAHERFRAKASGLPSFVLRGRLATDPESGARM